MCGCEHARAAYSHVSLTPWRFLTKLVLRSGGVHPPPCAGCGSGGCAIVVGVMFELADENDAPDDKAERCFEFLDAIWSVMPAEEGVSFGAGRHTSSAVVDVTVGCAKLWCHC